MEDKTAIYEEMTGESDTDIMAHENINPYRYIDITMQRISAALSKENIENGFLQFIILVNKLEFECKGLKIIDNNYYEEIKLFLGSNEYTKASDRTKDVKLANKKYGILFKMLCEVKETNEPLIVKK